MQSKIFLFLLLLSFFFSSPKSSQAQLGVCFHHSEIFKIGAFYEIRDFIIAETRIISGTVIEDLSMEFLAHVKAVKREDYEFYAGAGWGQSSFSELIGPILTAGLNIYPLTNKKLGIQFEFNPIFPEDLETPVIIRGSWGLRYRLE